MSDEPIPTHKLNNPQVRIGLEPIVPKRNAVLNDVHRHDFFEIFLLRTGRGNHMIDLMSHRFEGPCLHLVSPGQVHRLARSADTDGLVVMFKEDVDFGLINSSRDVLFSPAGSTVEVLSEQQLTSIEELLGSIRKELEEGDEVLAVSYLGILLKKCVGWFGIGKQMRPEKDMVVQFLRLLDKRFAEVSRVSEYADLLNVTAGHLSDLVKERLGRSCGQMIKERRLLEAKRLLLHSDMSVKEIAYSLSMDDPAYFTRVFKKDVGEAPGDYRKSIREKYK